VVRVVGLARDEALQQLCEVFEEARLELVHTHAARRVRGVDAGDSFRDAALADRVGDLVGDVADAQPAARAYLRLALEHLHGSLILLGRAASNRAYSEGSGQLRHG